ncbi:MAG: UDP-2,3-diacylglucosamine hydrolase [Flavobacteriaceae bacterium]|nr:MAG: UDP-2,3-diacylglucosamine hydrolase [Flavobacteriaceae bacterium]
MKKRKLEVLVLSDIHLGTYGCRAQELLNYLKTVKPEILVLNGDIIDVWQFNKRYFPKAHIKVIKHFMSLVASGTKVYYITGNHDEMFRKFAGFKLGSFEIVNKLVLNIDGAKTWFFHGDVFDVTMQHSKWLAKLGGVSYDFLILINTCVNWSSDKLGYGKVSLSKKIKNSVKGALNFINDFESLVADMAIYKNYQVVVCGHIHQPEIKNISNKEGKEVLYLNSGDWVENLTALEYTKECWELYEYASDGIAQHVSENKGRNKQEDTKDNEELFQDLLKEFELLN